MITLIIRGLQFLLRLFSRARTQIDDIAEVGRNQIRAFRKIETSEKLPENPPMPDVKLDVSGADEAIDLLNKTQIEVERVLLPELRSHGVSLCNDLIRSTPPLANGAMGSGGSPSALQHGRMMLEKQIRSIFKPTQSMLFGHLVMAREWQACANYKWTPTSEGMIKDINSQNWKSVYARFQRNGWTRSEQEIVQIPTPALHRAARGKDGATNKTYFVRQKAAIDAFVRQKAMLIGKMISGWVDARDSIGSPPADGTNVNTKSLGMGSGRATTVRQGSQSKVVLTNLFGDLNGVLTKTGRLQYLLDKRRVNLLNGFKKAVDKAVKVASTKAKKPPSIKR